MRECFAKNRSLIVMLVVVGIAAAVVFTSMAALVGKPPIIRDSFNYNTSAMRVLNTGTYQYDVAVPVDVTSPVDGSAFTTPGYTLFLAKIYSVLPHGGTTPEKVISELLGAQPVIIAAQLLLAVLMAVAVAYAGYRLGDLATGWAAGLMTVAYLPFGYNATVALTETLSLFLMALMVAAAVVLLAKREPLAPRAEMAWMAAFGLASGAQILTRGAITLWLAVPLAVWLLSNRARMKRALVVAAIGAACVLLIWAPWIVRNYKVYGSFVPLTSSVSTPLLDSTGGAVFTEEEEAIRTAAEARGEDPNQAVAMYRLKMRWNADPGEFLGWKFGILRMGVSTPTNLPVDILLDQQSSGEYAPNTSADAGAFLPNPSDALYRGIFDAMRWYHLALLALSVVGLAVGWRRRAIWVLASVPIYFAAVHTAVLFMVRYFYPAMVPIILLAAYGAVGGWLLLRERMAAFQDSLADESEVA